MADQINNTGLSIEDVKHVAKLANLTLTEEEIKKFQEQLSQILDYVNQLQEVNTSGIKETSQVTGLENEFREDEVNQSLSQAQALSNAKNIKNGYIQVPHVFKEII